MFPIKEQLHIIMGYAWLIGALLLLISEAGTPGLFFFISLALGATCSAPFAFLQFSFFTQALVWLSCSLFWLVLLRCYAAKNIRSVTKTNIGALVNQKATVTAVIEAHAVGYVKVGGELWPAIAQQSVILHQGTTVTVVGVQGNKLIVK